MRLPCVEPEISQFEEKLNHVLKIDGDDDDDDDDDDDNELFL